MTVRDVRITDDRRAAARELLSTWQTGRTMMANSEALTEQDVLDSPHVTIGTVAQITAQLQQQREQWNINYFEINSGDMDTLAPVIQRLQN